MVLFNIENGCIWAIFWGVWVKHSFEKYCKKNWKISYVETLEVSTIVSHPSGELLSSCQESFQTA